MKTHRNIQSQIENTSKKIETDIKLGQESVIFNERWRGYDHQLFAEHNGKTYAVYISYPRLQTAREGGVINSSKAQNFLYTFSFTN